MLPLFESLELREFMSASSIKHAVKAAPPAKKKEQPAVHAVAAAPAPVAWNDLAGNWSGTFSNNIGMSGSMSASFQNGVGVSNTGTFNLTAMVGQSGLLTTTTPDAYGNVLITVPIKGGFVSFVSSITADSDVLSGRWCTRIGTTFMEGYFSMKRV
jgi:hypothetical protein